MLFMGGNLMKNSEGYSDPIYGQALPAIRREENTRAREKRYGVRRGEVIYIYISSWRQRMKDIGR